MLEHKKIEADLLVVGGGLAGLCCAVSAARNGLSVVLMHDRSVLGGNASSEIRMWVCGARGEHNRETGLIEEIMLENYYRNPTKNYFIWDTVLYGIARAEKNLTLLLDCAAMDAETEAGDFRDGRTVRIKRVTGYQTTTQIFFDVEATYFADCSGDSILAPLTGAHFRIGREGTDEFGEKTSVKEHDDMTMGMSVMVYGRETTGEVRFTPPEWAAKPDAKNYEKRYMGLADPYENFWYLELGGDRDAIRDTEALRDELIGLALGTWDYVKNREEAEKAKNWDIDFLGFLPGKRESRRMCGEYTVTGNDILSGRVFEDTVAYGGWPMDDHYPAGFYRRGAPNKYTHTPSPYTLPYRALYSENVENLFFAGRNISMTHTAMSSARVMATCALLGEAVGTAASVAKDFSLTPHGVYLEKIGELQERLMRQDVFLPHFSRKVSDICRLAPLFCGESPVTGALLRSGNDREHILCEGTKPASVKAGEALEYRIGKPARIERVHITFDSDLDRESFDVSVCEREHSMRANVPLDAPKFTLPSTLCRSFSLIGTLDGKSTVLFGEENNRKRAYDIPVRGEFDTLTLVPHDAGGTRVISFDFT